jgi:hypothetical protein
VKLDFGLSNSELSEEARKAWPLDFALQYSVTLAKDKLQTIVNVRNEGDKSFEFQFLLHTYLRIKVRSLYSSLLPCTHMPILGHFQSGYQWPTWCRIHR